MLYGEEIYAVTGLILVTEIIAGRHRGIYQTWLVCDARLHSWQRREPPIGDTAYSSRSGHCLTKVPGALAGTDAILAFSAIFVLTEFAFYWVHRFAHQANGGPNAHWTEEVMFPIVNRISLETQKGAEA